MLIGSENGRYERLLSSPRFGRRAAGAVIGRLRCPSDAGGHVGRTRVIGLQLYSTEYHSRRFKLAALNSTTSTI